MDSDLRMVELAHGSELAQACLDVMLAFRSTGTDGETGRVLSYTSLRRMVKTAVPSILARPCLEEKRARRLSRSLREFFVPADRKSRCQGFPLRATQGFKRDPSDGKRRAVHAQRQVEVLAKYGHLRAILRDEAVHLQQKAGVPAGEILQVPAWYVPQVRLELLRKLLVVILLVSHNPQQVPNTAVIVLPKLAQVSQELARQKLVPSSAADGCARKGLQDQKQSCVRCFILVLHHVADVT
eukprot:scaffold626_cov337-Pavlova_lutheri.AAC.21